MVGYRADGKPQRKYIYGKTQKEVKEKVEQWKQMQKRRATMRDKTAKQIAEELLDLTVDEACMYLDDNHTEEEREEIVAALWEVYHARCAAK